MLYLRGESDVNFFLQFCRKTGPVKLSDMLAVPIDGRGSYETGWHRDEGKGCGTVDES